MKPSENIRKILENIILRDPKILYIILTGIGGLALRKKLRRILNKSSKESYLPEIEAKLSNKLKIFPEYQEILENLLYLQIDIEESDDINFIKARNIIKHEYYDQILGDFHTPINNLRVLLTKFFNESIIIDILFNHKSNDKIFQKEGAEYEVKDKDIILFKLISNKNLEYLQKLDKECKELRTNKINNKLLYYLRNSRKKLDLITDPTIKFNICRRDICEINEFIPIFCLFMLYDDLQMEFLKYINYSLSNHELKRFVEDLIVMYSLRNKYEHRVCTKLDNIKHKENVKKARDLTYDTLNLLAKFPLEKG